MFSKLIQQLSDWSAQTLSRSNLGKSQAQLLQQEQQNMRARIEQTKAQQNDIDSRMRDLYRQRVGCKNPNILRQLLQESKLLISEEETLKKQSDLLFKQMLRLNKALYLLINQPSNTLLTPELFENLTRQHMESEEVEERLQVWEQMLDEQHEVTTDMRLNEINQNLELVDKELVARYADDFEVDATDEQIIEPELVKEAQLA